MSNLKPSGHRKPSSRRFSRQGLLYTLRKRMKSRRFRLGTGVDPEFTAESIEGLNFIEEPTAADPAASSENVTIVATTLDHNADFLLGGVRFSLRMDITANTVKLEIDGAAIGWKSTGLVPIDQGAAPRVTVCALDMTAKLAKVWVNNQLMADLTFTIDDWSQPGEPWSFQRIIDNEEDTGTLRPVEFFFRKLPAAF